MCAAPEKEVHFQSNFVQHIKRLNFVMVLKQQNGIMKSNTHRFLLHHQFGKNGHMDTCGQEVNMEDNRSNFLSWSQSNTWNQQTSISLLSSLRIKMILQSQMSLNHSTGDALS